MKHFAQRLASLVLIFSPILSHGQDMSEIRSFEVIPIESNKVLRVGVSATTPPLVFKYDGKIIGLEADLALALGEELEKEVTFVNVKHKHLLTELKNKNVDIVMSGMALEGGLRVRAAFTEPYLVSGQMVLCRDEDASKYTSLQEIRKASRIGVTKKSIGHRYVEKSCPDAKIKTYGAVKDAVKDLLRGKIDLYVDHEPVVRWLDRRHAGKPLTAIARPLTTEKLAWAMHKTHKLQVEKINAILNDWRADGTLDEIIEKWVPRRI